MNDDATDSTGQVPVVGQSLGQLTFGPVSRAHLSRYAAASLDLNPIHVDLDYARSAGHNDVFAHGMLTFGLAARLVQEWAGTGHIAKVSSRFSAMTRIHDTVVVTGSVKEIRPVATGTLALVEVIAQTERGVRTTVVAAEVVFPTPDLALAKEMRIGTAL